MGARATAHRIEIIEEPLATLAHYSDVRTAFEVSSVFDISQGDGFVLSERAVAPRHIKDYDAVESERPANWTSRFDLTNWGVLSAYVNGQRVGGAALAFDSIGPELLEGREDTAVLWDIRVGPEARGRGIGATLFRAAEDWARARGCAAMEIETQNNNVPACKFYAKQGCTLSSINPDAYPDFPDEVQMIWRKRLVK
ncbi:MAG: GNAT family N-acetyltransferase [bacterium]